METITYEYEGALWRRNLKKCGLVPASSPGRRGKGSIRRQHLTTSPVGRRFVIPAADLASYWGDRLRASASQACTARTTSCVPGQLKDA